MLIHINGTGAMHASDAAVVLQIIAQFDRVYPGGAAQVDCAAIYCGNLRPMSDALVNPQTDFCLHRLSLIWCVHGRVVWVGPQAFANLASVEFGAGLGFNFTALSQLPYLAQINAVGANGFTGAVPREICSCAQLQVLNLALMGGLTALPDCFDQTPQLFFVAVQGNQMGSVPDSLLSLPLLNYADFSSNAATHFNSSLLSSRTQPWLTALRLAQNSIVAPLPNCTGFAYMRDLSFDLNSFYVPNAETNLASHYFDQMPVLQTLGLANNNNLAMALPLLRGTSVLTSLSLSNNAFTGAMPPSWGGLVSLLTLSAANNLIVSPVTVLASMTSLQALDLSYNLITSAVGSAVSDAAPMLTQWIFESLPASLQTASFRGNGMIFNTTDNGYSILCALTHLDLGYNRIQLWYSALLSSCLLWLDVSHNEISGSLSAGFMAPTATFFDVRGNPGLSAPALLGWMQPDYTSLSRPRSPPCPS